MKKYRYEVHTYTTCDGWINCWTVDEKPQRFSSIADAQAELTQYLEDVQIEITNGNRSPDETFAVEEFKIFDRIIESYI